MGVNRGIAVYHPCWIRLQSGLIRVICIPDISSRRVRLGVTIRHNRKPLVETAIQGIESKGRGEVAVPREMDRGVVSADSLG